MSEASTVQASEPTGDYVLLQRHTGWALYATCATEAEIQRANLNLGDLGIATTMGRPGTLGRGGRMGLAAILQGSQRCRPSYKPP